MKRVPWNTYQETWPQYFTPHDLVLKNQHWLFFYLFTLQPNILIQILAEATFPFVLQWLNSHVK